MLARRDGSRRLRVVVDRTPAGVVALVEPPRPRAGSAPVPAVVVPAAPVEPGIGREHRPAEPGIGREPPPGGAGDRPEHHRPIPPQLRDPTPFPGVWPVARCDRDPDPTGGGTRRRHCGGEARGGGSGRVAAGAEPRCRPAAGGRAGGAYRAGPSPADPPRPPGHGGRDAAHRGAGAGRGGVPGPRAAGDRTGAGVRAGPGRGRAGGDAVEHRRARRTRSRPAHGRRRHPAAQRPAHGRRPRRPDPACSGRRDDRPSQRPRRTRRARARAGRLHPPRAVRRRCREGRAPTPRRGSTRDPRPPRPPSRPTTWPSVLPDPGRRHPVAPIRRCAVAGLLSWRPSGSPAVCARGLRRFSRVVTPGGDVSSPAPPARRASWRSRAPAAAGAV